MPDSAAEKKVFRIPRAGRMNGLLHARNAALAFGSLLLAASLHAQTDEWPAMFDPFRVITINLAMDTNDWETVRADTTYSINVPAWMWADGETNQLLIEVKRKSDPEIGPKVSLKLDINAYADDQEWRGLRKLSLENGNGGNSIVKEGFAHYMHRLAWQHGLYQYNPGFATWVKLYVNGEYIGVYVHAEERDKQFLKHRGMWKEGATWLYKNDPNPVVESGSGGDSPTYAYLCFSPFRNSCAQPNLESNLPPRIDMQGMLTLGAIEAFTANSDGLFTHDGKNVFFVDFLATNHLKRLYFPWDLDAGLGSSSVNEAIYGFRGDHSGQILSHYWFRPWYLHIMTDLLDGPLSAASLTAFLNQLEPVLTPALLADVNNGLGETPADHFQSIREWVTNRINNVRGQTGPIIGWPRFSQNGGEIIPGFQLSLTHTNASGTIYYTLDGTDPRGFGGAISGIAYAGSPITLNNSTHVTARVQSGTNWSALRQATFNVAHALDSLKLTEIMYHPRAAAIDEDGDEYEFVELKNTGGTALNLSGCSFDGFDYRFQPGTIVPAGGCLLLVRNSLPFGNRYPAVTFHGIYFGGLENSGEKLRLRNSDGNNIFSVEYDNDPPWPLGPDGFGYSLVNTSPTTDPDQPDHWRASANRDGSPGADDPVPAYGVGVVVNEVLTHTDPPLEDAIELYNPAASPIDVSGWFLSDQINNDDPAGALLKKFRIPNGTLVPAGGHKVFYETNFNADTNLPTSFALSQYGDQVYLSSANGSGDLTGYIVGATFGAADNGVAFGRYQTSVAVDFTALASRTLGTNNDAPRVGPVVINEVMYHPAAGGKEFVELRNLASTNVNLTGWTFDGAGAFVFPSDSIIAPGGFLLLLGATNITPEQFRASNQVPASVPILAHAFELQNDGEELTLAKPNDYPTNAPIVVDRVRYNDKSPWPTEADGEGPSLERFSSAAYGKDPLNWRTTKPGGSPGTAGSFSSVIAVATNSSWRHNALSQDLGTPWQAAGYSDSGWLSGDGLLGYGQPFVNTILSNAQGVTDRPVTTYFRKEFVVSDEVSAITNLTLQANYDDGFVAYLNGQEVARRSIAAGAVSFNTLASSHEGGTYEAIDLTSQKDKLLRGGNMLAIEVHQATANDSDLLWDASLTYTVAGTPVQTIQITAVRIAASGLLLEWTAVSGRQYRVGTSEDLNTWVYADPPVTASGSIAQWLDSSALASAARFYRVILVSF